MASRKLGCLLFLLDYYRVSSGYHGKQAIIFTNNLTYTKHLTLESVIYILRREVT